MKYSNNEKQYKNWENIRHKVNNRSHKYEYYAFERMKKIQYKKNTNSQYKI